MACATVNKVDNPEIKNRFAMIEKENAVIQCEIKAVAKQSISQGIWVTYELSNLTENPVQFLTWYTPFEGFMSKLFVVTDGMGNEVAYQGPMIKRAQPEPSDYSVIPPQRSQSTRVNLQQVYALTPGVYDIKMATKYVQVKTAGQMSNVSLCGQKNIRIEVTN